MAGRIRSIKPEILEDEKTAALPHLEWRLFVSLWLIADDYGNLRGDAGYIMGQTLWAAGESRETVAKAIEGLAKSSLLSRYSVRGQTYYHICGWDKHQKVDKPGKPRMPGPDESDIQSCQVDVHDSRDSREIVANGSREPRETLAPDLRPPTIDLESAARENLASLPATRSKPDRKKPATDCPDHWQPKDRHQAVCREIGADCSTEARRFRNHHGAKGNQFKNWDQAFDTWLDKATEFRGRNNTKSNGGLRLVLPTSDEPPTGNYPEAK